MFLTTGVKLYPNKKFVVGDDVADKDINDISFYVPVIEEPDGFHALPVSLKGKEGIYIHMTLRDVVAMQKFAAVDPIAAELFDLPNLIACILNCGIKEDRVARVTFTDEYSGARTVVYKSLFKKDLEKFTQQQKASAKNVSHIHIKLYRSPLR